MWFFTGKGDKGDSSLFSGERLPKSSIEFELIGTLDEVTAFIGLIVSTSDCQEIANILKQIQQDLSHLMGIIAGTNRNTLAPRFNISDAISSLEENIKHFGAKLEKPQGFIFCGSSITGAYLDVVRAIARRAERVSVRMSESRDGFEKAVLVYLNRLSSLFYVLRLFVDKIRN